MALGAALTAGAIRDARSTRSGQHPQNELNRLPAQAEPDGAAPEDGGRAKCLLRADGERNGQGRVQAERTRVSANH